MNADVQHYRDAVLVDRKALVEQLHAIILDLFPEAIIDMTYRMPTDKVQSGWVAIANQKHYVSLYTCGAHHLVEFKRKHKKIKTGKGSINFKPTDVVPVGAVKNVIRHAIEHPK